MPRRTEDAWRLWRRAEKSKSYRRLLARVRALAGQGNGSALAVLSDMYEHGLSDADGIPLVAPEMRLAIEYEKRAADAGDASSITAVADRLVSSANGDIIPRQAELLYRKAFRSGYATAAYNLAVAYKKRSRYRDAVRWFRRAASSGDTSALLEVARAELYGVGTNSAPAAALKKLRRIARSKERYLPNYWLQCEAMLIIADILMSGWPVPANMAEGIRWLRKAAGLGNGPARALLEYYGESIRG